MNRIQTGIGHLPIPQLRSDDGSPLGAAGILRLASAMVQVISLLNGGLRFGNGEANAEAGNFDAIFLKVTFKAKDTEVVMPHDLGRAPAVAIPVFKDRACDVYSSRGAANAWGDDDKAYFNCSVDNAKVILLLA